MRRPFLFLIAKLGQPTTWDFTDPASAYLLSTENMELTLVGSQYTRVQKIANIVDIPDVEKYLNVCVNPDYEGLNCSMCKKMSADNVDFGNGGQTGKIRPLF